MMDIREQQTRPSTIYRPEIHMDGDKWIALYGKDLMDGVAGCGNSPAEAFADFDRAWTEKLEVKP